MRGVGVLTAGEVVNKLMRFGAAIVLARELTLEDFGLVNVAIAVGGLLFLACGLGLSEVSTRDVSLDPTRGQELADGVLGGRLIALGALSMVTLAIVAVVGPRTLPLVAMAVLMAAALACSLDWLLRGVERMAAVAAATAAGGTVVLVGTLTVVSAEPAAEVAIGTFVAGEIVVTALTLRFAGLRRLPRPRLKGLRLTLRRSWPLGASSLIVYSYYANLDTVLLSLTRSAEEAGLYSAPYRLFLALNVVGTFAAYAVLPGLSRAISRDMDSDDRAMDSLRRALLPLAAYGLVVLGLVELFGGATLRLLFGEAFESEQAVFAVLCLAIPWYTVSFPVGYALIARDANRSFLIGAGVAGALNLALNVALIPRFGTEGAAVATAAALVAGCTFWLRSHGMLDRRNGLVIGVLCASTIGALTTLVASEAAKVAGGLTVLAGVLLLMHGGRTLLRSSGQGATAG